MSKYEMRLRELERHAISLSFQLPVFVHSLVRYSSQEIFICHMVLSVPTGVNWMREKKRFLFSRHGRLKRWEQNGKLYIPIHEARSPQIGRGLIGLKVAEVSPKCARSDMPPKKKRKVKSSKPTKETKQGKTKNYWS